MNKKLFAFGLIAIMLATVFVGCKKGENDPALSLLSRKARLTGVWNLESANYTVKNGNDNVSIFTYDGATSLMTEDYDYYGIDGTDTYTYSRVLTIGKDDTFSDLETTIDGNTTTSTKTGYWYFAPGISDLDIKNKERVVFQTVESTQVNNNTRFDKYIGKSNENASIILLDQLSNKQITILYDYTHTDEDGFVSSIVGTVVFTQE